MQKFLLNVVKSALVMFAVGAILAVAAPYVGAAAGIVPSVAAATEILGTSANPLWLGSFFGMFGAASSALSPVINGTVDKVAGMFTRKKVDGQALSAIAAASVAGGLMQDASPALLPDPALGSTQFRDMVTGSRAINPSQHTVG